MFSTGPKQSGRSFLGGVKPHPGGKKLLKWTLTGLCILVFAGIFGFTGKVRAGIPYYQVNEITTDGTGALYMTITAEQNFQRCWEQRWDEGRNWNDGTGGYMGISAYGDWPDFSTAYPVKELDQNDPFCKNFSQGTTYTDLYLYDELNEYGPTYGSTTEEQISEAWNIDDGEMSNLTATSTIEASDYDESDVTAEQGEYYEAKPTMTNWQYSNLNELPVYISAHYENRPAGKQWSFITLGFGKTLSYTSVDWVGTTTTSGTTTWKIPQFESDEFNQGRYEDNYCGFQEGGSTPDRGMNLCPDFSLEIGEGTGPYLPLPEWQEVEGERLSTTTAQDFYDEHSDYATPTPAIEVILEGITPGYNWIKNITDKFSGLFDRTEAINRGEEMGEAVATGRAYAGSLNAFFGGLPISWALMIYITVALAVMVFRLIKGLIHIFRPT